MLFNNFLSRMKRKNELHDAFWKAMLAQDWSAVERLTIEGVDLTAVYASNEPNPPLVYAIECGAPLSLVQFLVEKGADINQPGEGRYTPLMMAASLGYVSIVEFLLEHGADAKARDHRGLSASDMARKQYERDIGIPLSNVQKIISILDQEERKEC